MHGAIGPSCARGAVRRRGLTVWTHTQGVYPLRDALAELLRLPKEQVRCIHVEGSGCYGHNGADDVAGDAALIARAMPGQPIRVQWMREDENTTEPSRPCDDRRGRGGAGRARRDRRLELRGLEQHPQPAAQRGRAVACRTRRCPTRCRCRRRRRSRCRKAAASATAIRSMRFPERAGGLALHAGHADARLGDAVARAPI